MTENPCTAPQSATQRPAQQVEAKPSTNAVVDEAHSVKVRVPEVFIYYQMVEQDVLN